MRVLLAGGGTGGHIYPALALARFLQKKIPEVKILFVGTHQGLENKIIPASGFELTYIPARGFSRKLSIDLIKSVSQALRGSWETKKILKKFNPDIVIGTGGYVSGPAVVAAVLQHRVTLIHEQNVIPGFTNRRLAPLVNKVCLSFESTRKYFPGRKNLIVTGNPRTHEVMRISRSEGCQYFRFNENHRIVVIVGGSQGAQKINDAAIIAVKKLICNSENQILYITGENYYNRVKQQIQDNKRNLRLMPYLNKMPFALAAADLIVSRAGATTLAEITARGIPSILIPSPNVAHNHQMINAQELTQKGAAIMIDERELTGDILLGYIESILCNENKLRDMRKYSLLLGIPDAAERFYQVIKESI